MTQAMGIALDRIEGGRVDRETQLVNKRTAATSAGVVTEGDVGQQGA